MPEQFMCLSNFNILAEILFAPARSHQGVLDSVISTRHGEGAIEDLKTIVSSVFLKSPGSEAACWVALDCVNLRDATQDPSLKAWAWAEETQLFLLQV